MNSGVFFVDLALELIKRHEGLRLKPYRCSAGKLTIGYGRNLERGEGISEREAEELLRNDILEVCQDLEGYSWYRSATQNRRAALVDLRFELGAGRFRGFKKFIAAMAAGDYLLAKVELLDSRYAVQVPNRANEIANMIEAG